MRVERSGFDHFLWLSLGLTIALGITMQSRLAAADTRTQMLRKALSQPMPSEGLRISVVLRKASAGISRVRIPDRIRSRRRAVLARMKRGRLTVGHRYRWLSGFSGWADAQAIAALMYDPDVVSIDIDRKFHVALAQGGPLVGATAAHALGVTGAGVSVAMLDTGIDTNHPAVSSSLIAEACFCDNNPIGNFGCCPNGRNTQTGAGAAEDDNGHGTQTTGVVVSSSVSNLGIAPDASIVSLKVTAANGVGVFSDVDLALDWVITNRVTFGIKIVNLSLSDGQEHGNASVFPCSGTTTSNAIAQLKALGVSVFVASGNDSFDNGISFPACIPDAFSVGGVYDATFPTVDWGVCIDTPASVDSFVCHSNSSSLLDLLAPQFRATLPTIGGGTANVGGTSFSSPYAAAQAALLLEADASLTPDQILNSLKIGAPMVTNPGNGLSFPRTRVDLAVAQILAVCGNGILEAGEACDDNNTISGDCCNASCQFESSGSSCDDADLCTITQACDGAGSCAGLSFLTCNDSNVCTDDSCNPASGCQFNPNTAPCDDLNACTSGDICAGGSCSAGSPVTCNDSNVCTDDSCNPASGCQFNPNTLACTDANVCTNGDVCFGGTCTSNSTLNCDDMNDCTADGCDEITGCFHQAIQGCIAPPVPGLTSWGLSLLVGFMLIAALWTARIQSRV